VEADGFEVIEAIPSAQNRRRHFLWVIWRDDFTARLTYKELGATAARGYHWSPNGQRLCGRNPKRLRTARANIDVRVLELVCYLLPRKLPGKHCRGILAATYQLWLKARTKAAGPNDS